MEKKSLHMIAITRRGWSFLVALILFAGCRSHEASAPEEGAVLTDDPAAVQETTLLEGELEPGETPMGWVLRRGVEPNTAYAILEALQPHLAASRFRTDDRLLVSFASSGEPIRFEVKRRNRDRLIVERDASGLWVGSFEKKQFRREIARFEGEIGSSLWESITGRGASPELVILFADIFAWTFDFLTDCRSGDHFEFLVETLYDGEERVGYGDILVARYNGDRGEVEAVRYALPGEKAHYFARDGESLQKIFLKSPLNYRRISSGFTHARFHPILKRYRPHLGIDYAANRGTPIVSIGDGVVVKSRWNGGFGNYVEIKHNRTYTTTYGHLSKYGKGIKEGVRVSQGQVIGYVGSTGLSTGPHLDFRMKKNGTHVNPLKIDVPSADPIPKDELADFLQHSGFYFAALQMLPEGFLARGNDLTVTALLGGSRSGLIPQAPAIGDRPAP